MGEYWSTNKGGGGLGLIFAPRFRLVSTRNIRFAYNIYILAQKVLVFRSCYGADFYAIFAKYIRRRGLQNSE